MSDYTDREIPVLDDIISSPVKTDELLADAKISDEPAIQAPELYENVQLDIQLDEPVLDKSILIPETHASPAHDELSDTPHHLIHTELGNSEHSDTRIEPALHQAQSTETFEHEIDTTTDNTDSFATNTTNDSVSETIENDSSIKQHSEQQTSKEEHVDEAYDDPDILPSGERLYRYIPDVPQPETHSEVETQNTDTQDNTELTHIDALEPDISDGAKTEALAIKPLASENQQTETSYAQNQSEAIADTNNYDDGGGDSGRDGFISSESVFKTETDIIKEDKGYGDTDHNHKFQTDYCAENVTNNDDASIQENAQQTDMNKHESALIDYQTDIDPYSIDETEDITATSNADTITDNAPQWQDIEQEISSIQAETNSTITPNPVLTALDSIDTDAITEQVLQNILPNLEQRLRLHIKESLQLALSDALKQSPSSSTASEDD